MGKKNRKYLYIFMCLYLVMFGFETIVSAAGLSCDSWGDLKRDLQNIFNFAKIVIPLLVIGLSSYDFIRAITSKEAKDVKKAFNTLLKRFLYAIIFFFLPVLLNFLLDLIGTNSDICIE